MQNNKASTKKEENGERRGKEEDYEDWSKLYAPSGRRWAVPVCSSWGGQNEVISISPELRPSGQDGFAEIKCWFWLVGALQSLLRSLTSAQLLLDSEHLHVWLKSGPHQCDILVHLLGVVHFGTVWNFSCTEPNANGFSLKKKKKNSFGLAVLILISVLELIQCYPGRKTNILHIWPVLGRNAALPVVTNVMRKQRRPHPRPMTMFYRYYFPVKVSVAELYEWAQFCYFCCFLAATSRLLTTTVQFWPLLLSAFHIKRDCSVILIQMLNC